MLIEVKFDNHVCRYTFSCSLFVSYLSAILIYAHNMSNINNVTSYSRFLNLTRAIYFSIGYL